MTVDAVRMAWMRMRFRWCGCGQHRTAILRRDGAAHAMTMACPHGHGSVVYQWVSEEMAA